MGMINKIGIVFGLIGFLMLFTPFISDITGFFISPSGNFIGDNTGISYIYFITSGFAIAIFGLILYRHKSERKTVLSS